MKSYEYKVFKCDKCNSLDFSHFRNVHGLSGSNRPGRWIGCKHDLYKDHYSISATLFYEKYLIGFVNGNKFTSDKRTRKAFLRNFEGSK